MAVSTRSTYASFQRSWLIFCSTKPSIDPLAPAELDLVYFASLRGTKVQFGTVRCNLYAIRSLIAENRGVFLDFKQFCILQKTLKGIKRHWLRINGPRIDNRLPVTVAILKLFLVYLDPTNPVHATLRAAFTIAVFCLLRCGEFTIKSLKDLNSPKLLKFRNLRFCESDGVVWGRLRLIATKTELFRSTIFAIFGDCPGLSPYKEIKNMISLVAKVKYPDKSYSDPIEAFSPSEPLFQIPTNSEFTSWRPLMRSDVTNVLKYIAKFAGVDDSRFNGHSVDEHSFRKGGMSTLAALGAPSILAEILPRILLQF